MASIKVVNMTIREKRAIQFRRNRFHAILLSEPDEAYLLFFIGSNNGKTYIFQKNGKKSIGAVSSQYSAQDTSPDAAYSFTLFPVTTYCGPDPVGKT